MKPSDDEKDILLPQGNELILSASPHIHDGGNVTKIMLKVILCLVPALIGSFIFFGWNAMRVLFWCVLFCVAAEALWCYMAGKPVKKNLKDCSAILTGILLAMNLSSLIPWWICLIGAILAIWLGKQVFGGLGNNPFNPALVARVGLLIALPGYMTLWQTPETQFEAKNIANQEIVFEDVDAISCATPLGEVSTAKKILDRSEEAKNNFSELTSKKALWNYFIGNVGGSLGETSTLALLIGAVMLMLFKLINWRIPLFYLGSVALLIGGIHLFYPGVTPGVLFHLLTGGLMLGAFFMATDMVTSPASNRGAIIFAVGCGIITVIIRVWGNYPEGVSFAILFMNALVPLIDRICLRKPFGYIRENKSIAEAIK